MFLSFEESHAGDAIWCQVSSQFPYKHIPLIDLHASGSTGLLHVVAAIQFVSHQD